MRCPRCLNPVDDEGYCVDARCGYGAKRNSLRPFWRMFVLVGLVHLALVWRFGIPGVQDRTAIGFWLFVAICWLFVNSAATVVLYAAYVFAYELHPGEYRQWLAGAKRTVRPIS